MAIPLLIFDGDCGFCRIWVQYWNRLTGDRVAYEPYQNVASQFPDIPPERFAKSVHLALPGGRLLGGPHAVFQARACAPDRPREVGMYDRLPRFAAISELVYGFIAQLRPLL